MHCGVEEGIAPEIIGSFILLSNRFLLSSYFLLGTELGSGYLLVKKEMCF